MAFLQQAIDIKIKTQYDGFVLKCSAVDFVFHLQSFCVSVDWL